MNSNSILFLYEGETESEFYNKLFQKYLPYRQIRISKYNLFGIFNLNKKVRNKISWFLNEKKDQNQIHVIIALDRDGQRSTPSKLDDRLLRKDFISQKSRVETITPIVATQDLESWFFHDIEGIYNFLKVPKSKRNIKKYTNVEATNNKILSQLFHRYNKHYQKGTRVSGFLEKLDIDLIYINAEELQSTFKFIQSLCK